MLNPGGGEKYGAHDFWNYFGTVMKMLKYEFHRKAALLKSSAPKSWRRLLAKQAAKKALRLLKRHWRIFEGKEI